MSEKTLKQAVGFIEGGEKEKGRELLLSLADNDPENENIWLWLAACGEGEVEKEGYLEKVLQINPGNAEARQALAKLLPVRQPSLEELVSLPGILEVLERASEAEARIDFEQGYKHYNQAIKIDPEHAGAWLGRGRCAAALNAIDLPRLGEAIESICKGKELGADKQPLEAAAHSLALAIREFVNNLEDHFKEQQIEKMDELSSPFFNMGYGGALSQKAVDRIGKDQNQKFQILIPSFIEGLTLAWEVAEDKEIGMDIQEVSRTVADSSIYIDTSKRVFREKINSLLEKVRAKFPGLEPKQVETPKMNIWVLIVIILVVGALVIMATQIK